MALDVTSLLNPNRQSPLEQLLAAYRAQQSRPLEALQRQQKQLQEQQKLLATLRTKLEELYFRAQLFTLSGAAERFATRKLQSSAPDIVTGTAQNSALLGSVSLTVHRLARNDTLVSDRLNRTSPFGLSGTYRFELTANGSTATVEVTLDGTEDTETALRKIAAAVNATASIGVVATLILDTATTVRLSLTAKQTGSDAAITFTDTDGLLASLGWNSSLFADPENRTVMTDTTAGYQLARVSELNAELNLNGITVVRPTNTISDLLPGITLTLLRSQQPGDAPVTLTTTVDADKVAAFLKDFLDSYNAALKELNSALQTTLKGDPSLRQIRSQLRLLSSQLLGSGPLKTLRDIGITVGSDGTLSLSDRTRLEQELSIGSDRVAALFTSAGGLGERIVSALHDTVGSSGTLRLRWQSIGTQLQTLNSRISQLQKRVDQQVEQYRKEYLKLQQLYSMASAQLGMITNFATPPTGLSLLP